MNKTSKRTFTTGEIAKYCGVNFRTVIRWIERGHLKSYKLPGRGDNRVELKDFLEFLEQNSMPVPEELAAGQKRILVVDDEEAMASAISRLLRRAGYEVAIANSGFVAGSMMSSFEPSLITLDLQMPDIDGFEVLEFIQQSENRPKVLVVSGMTADKLQEAKAGGADDVIGKPFDNAELVERVAGLLGH